MTSPALSLAFILSLLYYPPAILSPCIYLKTNLFLYPNPALKIVLFQP